MKDNILNVKHRKVRELLNRIEKEGYVIKTHKSNKNVLNVFCPKKQKNVIGDISTQSLEGYFRLQRKEDHKWVSFRKIGLDIESERFVEDILMYIKD